MSTQDQTFDEDVERRSYTKPHSGKHPIPTVQKYRAHRRELEDQLERTQEAQEGPEDASRPKRALNSVKHIFRNEDKAESRHEPYPATNRHYVVSPDGRRDSGPVDDEGGKPNAVDDGVRQDAQQQNDGQDEQQKQQDKSATEHAASTTDPKAKRKAMKKASRQTGGREVTDPVTHLPLVIHDQTEKDLQAAPENEPEPGEHHTTATGPQAASKSDEELQEESEMVQRGFNGVQRLFPPPEFGILKKNLADAYQRTVKTGLTVIGTLAALPFLVSSMSSQGRWIPPLSTIISVCGILSVTLGTAWGMGKWVSKKVSEIVDDETWDSSRREEQAVLDSDTELPESVQWLNSMLSSIWPLINPDLFASLIDQIEDVMQASLPKVVKMVSIDDMGQGNQSLRILGVRWLPSGAAGQTVGSGGQLDDTEKKGKSDRTDPENAQASETEELREKDLQNGGEGKDDDKDEGKSKQDEQDEVAIREGMEAEEGDFVNLEMALAYRSRASGKSMREKAKSAHLFLKFYSVGGIAFPVWVEVRGFIATMRLRLQLTVSTLPSARNSLGDHRTAHGEVAERMLDTNQRLA